MNQQFKFRNLIIDFIEDTDYEADNGPGGCEFTFPIAALTAAVDYANEEEITHYNAAAIAELLEEAENYKDTAQVSTENTDTAIALIGFLLDYKGDTTYQIQTKYAHPIWLFHDLFHAACDHYDFELLIMDFHEERAINGSIEILAECKIPMPYHIIQQSEKAYAQRFNAFGANFMDYARQKENYLPIDSAIDLSPHIP